MKNIKNDLNVHLKCTKPDYVVYVPKSMDGSTNDTGNEHFLVFDGPDNSLMAVWTQSTREGQPDQRYRAVGVGAAGNSAAAGHADGDGVSRQGRGQLGQALQQLEALGRRLGEPDPRVDEDALGCQPRRLRLRDGLLQLVRHPRDDPLRVAGHPLHGRGHRRRNSPLRSPEHLSRG